MAKDKKKKKKQEGDNIESLKEEYESLIEVTKAKNKQLDGMIQEVRTELGEIRKLKEQLIKITAPLDNE